MAENGKEEKPKIEVDRQTQIAIMNFFLKTSIPRILNNRNEPQEYNDNKSVTDIKYNSPSDRAKKLEKKKQGRG